MTLSAVADTLPTGNSAAFEGSALRLVLLRAQLRLRDVLRSGECTRPDHVVHRRPPT